MGCDGRRGCSTQENLQNVQRLHDRAEKRFAFRMLSPGQLLQDFRISRAAEDCEGQAMTIETLIARRRLRRKVQGIAAALLPFESDGRVAVKAFQSHLVATHRAGLMNAVNMDTGYVNYLSEAEKEDVLRCTRDALGKDVPFVTGAYIEDEPGDTVELYRKQMDVMVSHGAIPILFQTSRLHGKPAKEKVAIYQAACRGYSHVLAFELGPVFAPSGEIFDEETFRRLMDIPEIKRRKVSSSKISPLGAKF